MKTTIKIVILGAILYGTFFLISKAPINQVFGAQPALTIPQGGTGQTSFPLNTLLYVNSSLRLAATSSNPLYVGALFATSTTATSVFNGQISVSSTSTLGTTTASMINGVIVVDGVHYAQTGCGVKNAISDAPTGSTVYVPNGTYLFASGCNFNFGGKSIKLIGASATSTIFKANGVAGGFIYDYFGVDTLPSERPNIEIANITFDVNYTPSFSAISMGSSQDLYIHHNKIINEFSLWAVVVGAVGGTVGSETAQDFADSASSRFRFEHNEVAYSKFSTYEGVLCVNCKNFNISDNYFHDLTQGPAALALYVGSTMGTVLNNRFASSTIRAFYSSGADNFTYAHNKEYAASSTIVTSAGIQIFNTTHAIFDDNIIVGTNDGSAGGGGFTIYDYNGPLDGHVYLKNATTSDITISNNIVYNSYYGVVMGSQPGTDKHYEKHDIHIVNNKFYNTLWEAVHIGTSGSTLNDSTQNMSRIYITGNKEFGTNRQFSEGIYAIVGSSTAPTNISNVYISDNYATRSSAGGDSAGVYVDGASSVKIYNNSVDGVGKGAYSDVQVTTNTSNVVRSQMSFANGFTFFTRFGIGTSTPFATLAVQATTTQTNPIFEVASSSNATKFLSVAGSGFGTTTLSGLSISGSATSSSNVGFNLTGGCFSISNVCLGSGSGTVNSGVYGQMAFYGANGTVVSGTSTIVIATTSSANLVGIGTTSPQAGLNVQTTGSNTGIQIDTPQNIPYLKGNTSGLNYFGINYTTGAYVELQSFQSKNLILNDQGNNVGIANNAPNRKLTVGGELGLSSGNASSLWHLALSGSDLQFNESGVATRLTFKSGGNVGIATTSPFSSLSVNSSAGISPFSIGSSTGSYLFMGTTGNLGIGLTNPIMKLVVGDITSQNTLRINGLSTANMAPVLSLFRSGAVEWALAAGGSGIGDFTISQNPAGSVFSDANLLTGTKFIIKDATGNVGIGTSTPMSRLHVSSGANATTTVTVGELGLSTSKGCVNMNTSAGTAASFYINAAGVMVSELGYCK